jgi:hypothetical protein
VSRFTEVHLEPAFWKRIKNWSASVSTARVVAPAPEGSRFPVGCFGRADGDGSPPGARVRAQLSDAGSHEVRPL